MEASAKVLTRLTIELSSADLDKIMKGALVQATVCSDEDISYLLEIYCDNPPHKKFDGQILEDLGDW